MARIRFTRATAQRLVLPTAGIGNTIAPNLKKGTVEIAEGATVTIHRVGEEPEVYEAPEIEWEGHDHLFDEFLNWLDWGPPSETRIEKNIISYAMVIAAMETTLDGQPKKIADYVADLDL